MRSVLCLLRNAKRVRDLGSLGIKSPYYCASPAGGLGFCPPHSNQTRQGHGGREAYGFYFDFLLVHSSPPYNLYNPKVGLLTVLTLPL